MYLLKKQLSPCCKLMESNCGFSLKPFRPPEQNNANHSCSATTHAYDFPVAKFLLSRGSHSSVSVDTSLNAMACVSANKFKDDPLQQCYTSSFISSWLFLFYLPFSLHSYTFRYRLRAAGPTLINEKYIPLTQNVIMFQYFSEGFPLFNPAWIKSRNNSLKMSRIWATLIYLYF